ncbi:hypothetical protein phiYY_sM5 [Pseudomonas phage phiYY]|uniref:Uncharacterized protein n=1 Tax=Pseudomonas phage phiYY TaxID=1852644 RepID=A0A1U9AK65_9VIRU|nr:hypothetical protein phiYY_sM5 [Pseudomonas phage phiYY]ANM47312.1 hypothetical protein phiYY_sM5 [Pseudomonas phage phiYY]
MRAGTLNAAPATTSTRPEISIRTRLVSLGIQHSLQSVCCSVSKATIAGEQREAALYFEDQRDRTAHASVDNMPHPNASTMNPTAKPVVRIRAGHGSLWPVIHRCTLTGRRTRHEQTQHNTANAVDQRGTLSVLEGQTIGEKLHFSHPCC